MSRTPGDTEQGAGTSARARPGCLEGGKAARGQVWARRELDAVRKGRLPRGGWGASLSRGEDQPSKA